MKKILLLILLILPACTTISTKKSESVNVGPSESSFKINPVDNWEYPGKFYPVSGEFLASFFNEGTELTNCQLQALNDIAVANIRSFMDNKKMITEEKRNFVQLDLNPGYAWLLIKNQNPEVALHECINLQKYLKDTFNFSLKK